MTSTTLKFILLLALVLEAGCVTTRAEGNALRSDMRMLKDEMARMNRVQMEDKALVVEKLGDVSNRLEQTENNLRSLRQQNADHGLKTEKIIAELQAVRGEVEEVRHELGKTSKSVADLLVRPPVSVATAVDAPPVPQSDEQPQKTVWPKEEKALFAMAETKFKAEEFSTTIQALNVYLKQFKGEKNKVLDEAYFLKGEAYSALAGKSANKKGKEDALRKAVLAYQNVLTGYPKSKRAAAVLYKIGQAFESLGFQKDAVVFYEEVVAKHKKSAFVPKARKRIKTIKKLKKSKKK
mgnify:CR=1 FL=1